MAAPANVKRDGGPPGLPGSRQCRNASPGLSAAAAAFRVRRRVTVAVAESGLDSGHSDNSTWHYRDGKN